MPNRPSRPRAFAVSSGVPASLRGGGHTVLQIAALDHDHASLAVELANRVDRQCEFIDYAFADDHQLTGRLFYNLARTPVVKYVCIEPFATSTSAQRI
jgi:hypothetical protein